MSNQIVKKASSVLSATKSFLSDNLTVKGAWGFNNSSYPFMTYEMFSNDVESKPPQIKIWGVPPYIFVMDATVPSPKNNVHQCDHAHCLHSAEKHD